MTPAQKRLKDLDAQKASVKLYYKNLAEALSDVAKEIGVNGYFQDEEGTVYKVVEPEGKFVTFEKLGYVRTKKPGEVRGDLSVKEAEEHGFKIPK